VLRFLLDEHISPAVCLIVRERSSGILIESLVEWREGSLRGKDDSIVLAAAAEAGYALVTYDLRTIPPLLRVWAAKGLSHQGVVFIDERTCRPQDFSAIADALIRIWDDLGTFEWRDRVAFASRAQGAN
jgi:hypothetical protein